MTNLLSIVIPTGDVPWQVLAVAFGVCVIGAVWAGVQLRKGKR